MESPARPSVDLNTLLAAANVLVGVLTILVSSMATDHPYVDRTTFLFAGALLLQTQAALMLERRRRDPFVLLLAYVIVFFYSLRVVTLTWIPVSTVFYRFSYGPSDTNFGLMFVILANCVVYGALFVVRLRDALAIDVKDWRPAFPTSVTILLAAAVIFNYTSDRFWPEGEGPRIFNFLRLIISPYALVPMSIAFWFLFRKQLSRRHSIAITALILIEVALHLLYGSRSAIPSLFQGYMIVGLVVYGVVRLPRRYTVLAVAALPFVLIAMMYAFLSSTYARGVRQGGVFSLSQAIEITGVASQQIREGSVAAETVLGAAFARAGFLDYSAELIANRDRYGAVVNLPTYFKSIVDNTLTPGFDVFDQPKISNSLPFVWEGLGTPSKRNFVQEYGYHSDQLGWYGEMYVLFGFASLPVFFLITYGFKRLYVGLRTSNPFTQAMIRLVIMTAFLTTINSYGFDWTLTEALSLSMALVVYSVAFSVKRPPGEEAPMVDSRLVVATT